MRGRMINNKNKSVKETVMPNDWDNTKLDGKLFTGPVMVTVRAISVQMIKIIMPSLKTFLKSDQY